MDAGWFDYLLQAGLPAGLGVFIVFYLLKYMIPGQQQIFRESLTELQSTFRDALKTEQTTHSADLRSLAEEHRATLDQLRSSMLAESQHTRQAIDALALQTGKLSEAVFKLYGRADAGR